MGNRANPQEATLQVVDQNKLYASEVLSILVQDSEANQLRVGQGEGIDRLTKPATLKPQP